ncbi:hypothetical protein QE152_g10227 [Popillia japonica]|uniref:Nuclease HARBI1 n=1 Tax=Popillia japonica TaxID=7064 RepID=A0AAW1LVP4_POPJA
MSVLKKRQQLRKSLNRISALLEEAAEMLQEEIVNKKRIWVRKWIEDRETTGGSILLMKQLRSEDPQEYRSGLRMTPENFDELLSLVANSIQRKDTLMRDALPAKVKLEITLTYLATGMSFRSLSHFHQVSKPSISLMIPEVCGEIYTSLKQFIKVFNVIIIQTIKKLCIIRSH